MHNTRRIVCKVCGNSGECLHVMSVTNTVPFWSCAESCCQSTHAPTWQLGYCSTEQGASFIDRRLVQGVWVCDHRLCFGKHSEHIACATNKLQCIAASQSEALLSHADAQRLEAALCRVSGNVVNDFVLGSIMSAVHVYGVRLVVVLGHTRCGMVARAIQHWAKHEHRKALDSLSAASEQVKPLIIGLMFES